MRIIAGEHRGRRILGPLDAKTTRPITDRVKEALFDRLWAMGFFSDDGAGAMVDIFCGTGSLGLEALSRGARQCTFVDRDRKVAELLKENIETLGETERAVVKTTDALSPIWVSGLQADPPGLIFFDPPYAMLDEPATVQRLNQLMQRLAPVCHPEAGLVLRTPRAADPLEATGWRSSQSHIYGSMTLHFYDRQPLASDQGQTTTSR